MLENRDILGLSMNKIIASTSNSDNLKSQFLSSLKTVDKLRKISQSDEIIFDLKNLEWALPTYLAPISCKINEIKNLRKNI